jgi:hypothetical protein
MTALDIPSETLLQLADALDAEHVRGPLTKFGLRAFTTSAGAIASLEALRQVVGGERAPRPRLPTRGVRAKRGASARA